MCVQDDDVWGMLDESEESSSEDEAIPSGKLTLEYFLKKLAPSDHM